MAHRTRKRNAFDTFELVFKLGLLLGGLAMFSPAFRQSIYALGQICVAVLVLAAAGVLVFVSVRAIGRWSEARQGGQPQPMMSYREVSVQASPPPAQATPLPKLKGEWTEPTRKEVTKADLVQQLRSIDWFQFEKLVAAAYRKLGYTVSRRGGANPDGGIDLVIEKDGQRSAVQCKQWKTWKVKERTVREFLGALTHAEIQTGVFITLCGYTRDAKHLADQHGIEIIDEDGLAQMLEDTAAGSDPETLAILSDPRKFCPKCEREMVLRTATKGKGAGQLFWGCSAYPKCRYTMTVS